MYNKIKILEKPTLYAKSEAAFWNDKHISQQMLKAHLDPEFEGASRKLDFIEKSVAWIAELVPPSTNPLLLDIGCGPGIYAERFAKQHYQVTGIDFSKRSIDYAHNSAQHQELGILYLYQNYLNMDLDKKYDFSTMIYCDYGALSTKDRQTIMRKIYEHLKPGGKFLLDVFSMEKYNSFQENQTWEIHHNGGFWSKDSYVALNGCYKYTNNVTLEQITVISDDKITPYYIWNTYFTEKSLIKEAEAMGFKICNIFGDVAGNCVHAKSPTLAILLEK